MWLFTKYGFFSAVCARQGNGQYGSPVDRSRLMVRARVRDHLQMFLDRFSEQLRDCEVMEFPGSDYAFRIFVDKKVWSEVLVSLNDEMDYDNFKSAVAVHQGKAGAAYSESLHEVWEIMHELQQ